VHFLQEGGVELRFYFIGVVALFFLVVTGCQTNNSPQNNINEVVHKHGSLKNLKGLNAFVENVKKQTKDEINFVQYGIEGQRGVKTLTYNGEQIKVSHSVDGDFVEKYNCKKIIVKNEKGVMDKYILVGCTGDFNGDYELLSVPVKKD
jgi:hypothetical protein